MSRRQEASQPNPTVMGLGLNTQPGDLPKEIGENLHALEEACSVQITIQYFSQFAVFQAEAKRAGAKSCAALACCRDPEELYETLRNKLTPPEEEKKGENDAPL